MEAKHKIPRWPEDHPEFKKELLTICCDQRKSHLLAVREEVVQYLFLRETRKKYAGMSDLIFSYRNFFMQFDDMI